MMVAGSAAGLASGYAFQRFIESLPYGVRGTDAMEVAIPVALLFSTAILAALPPVLRATRVDLMIALRYE